MPKFQNTINNLIIEVRHMIHQRENAYLILGCVSKIGTRLRIEEVTEKVVKDAQSGD